MGTSGSSTWHSNENIVLLDRPGTAARPTWLSRTVSAPDWPANGAVRPCDGVGRARLRAKRQGKLRQLGFVPLIVVDEVGYIPFDPEAANQMFGLVSARYKRASLITTSTNPCLALG